LTAVASDPNGQSPNLQILSSNTNTDNLSFVRQAEFTYQPFHFNDSSGDGYTYQVNALVNGAPLSCVTGTLCDYLYWAQGVVVTASSYGGTNGAFVKQVLIQEWDDGIPYDNCGQSVSGSEPNVNNTDYLVYQQDTLNTTSDVTELVHITDNNLNILYSYTQTCAWYYLYGPVYYYNEVEGVIVGPAGGYHTTFTPHSSELFDGYIDLTSNYNDMSSSNTTAQTGESSNLYQTLASGYGETYGSGYLYTVQSDENTKTTN